jgi:hypothetical protein
MEANSVEAKYVVVHEEFHTEDVTVKCLGTMKKRHRGRHLAAGQRGEPKELTGGDSES